MGRKYCIMKIQHLRLRNFRRFEKLEIENFHPQFNILIGDNGAGKTTLIDAINRAMSDYFVGLFGSTTDLKQSIEETDIRRKFLFERPELQYPVEIECDVIVNEKKYSASNEKTKQRRRKPSSIKQLAEAFVQQVQEGEAVNLPVWVYYGNGRNHLERNKSRVPNTYSRLEGGYYNGSNPTSNNKYFTEWYKGKFATILQTKKSSIELELIKKAIVACIPHAVNLYYNFEKGIDDLEIEMESGEKMPFKMLSDGYRSMLAMIADMAFRCISLNPHLGDSALRETEGVVLIDELDLYLHPIWQERVVDDLKRTFPKLQFIVTTHSPIIIANAEEKQVFYLSKLENANILPNNQSYQGWALPYILEDVMKFTPTDSIDLNPLLDKLDEALKSKNLLQYEEALNRLESIVHHDDPILSVYKLKKARVL